MSSTTANVNDMIDDDEEGLSGFTILAILMTLVVVFILVVMYAYRQGVASGSSLESESLPVVAADPRPVAEDVPPTTSDTRARQEVYDRVSGAMPTRIVTEEDPARDPLNGYGGAPQGRAVQQAQSAAAEPPADTPQGGATDPIAQTLAGAGAGDAAGVAATTPVPKAKPETVTTAARQPTAREAAPVRQRPAPATVPPAASGTHVVQVGAFDSNQAALDYFDGLSERLAGLLSGKRPDIQQATVKGRVYHRLRIGPFSSRADASGYCNRLKSRGQDCLVRGV